MNSMNEVLSAVQRRLWYRRLLRAGLRGLVFGTAFAIALAGLCLALSAPHLAGRFAAFAVAFGLVGGVLVALSQRPSLRSAAETIDRYYGMKDRTVSALAFSAEPTDDPLRRLQIADTTAHLRKVRAEDCVPLVVPHGVASGALGLLCVTVGIVAYSQWLIPTAEATSPIPLVQQQAALLRATVVAEIERLAEETGNEQLRKLSDELNRLTDVLQQQVRDEEAYFATLSAMEQTIAKAREDMQLRQSEKQLQDIAAAIKPAGAMRPAAEAVESGDYERAARELDAVDPSELSDGERRAVSDNLKKLQPQEQDTNSDSDANALAQAAKRLEQALDQKNTDQAKEAAEQISDAAKQQALAEAIEESMDRQMNRLSDAKGQGRNRGQTPSDTAQKTESPSETWGNAASGNPLDGDSAELQSARERQRLTGEKGEGASETETIEGTATEQTAQREYAERYQTYRRQAEAVLESEPLPIGHRETIRRYFENIRPQTPQ